jgi:3-isopropylmalate/(R)-2-methylmalate dehydratase large subunit
VKEPRTMFDKIWDAHVVAEGPGGQTLLFVDRHLLHEGSTHAFDRLQASGRSVRRPDLAFATADHYLPTTPPAAGVPDPEVRAMLASLGAGPRPPWLFG